MNRIDDLQRQVGNMKRFRLQSEDIFILYAIHKYIKARCLSTRLYIMLYKENYQTFQFCCFHANQEPKNRKSSDIYWGLKSPIIWTYREESRKFLISIDSNSPMSAENTLLLNECAFSTHGGFNPA